MAAPAWQPIGGTRSGAGVLLLALRLESVLRAGPMFIVVFPVETSAARVDPLLVYRQHRVASLPGMWDQGLCVRG